MSDTDETLSPDENLTTPPDGGEEKPPGSSEPPEEPKSPEELTKAVKGFQRDQQKSREREKTKDVRIAELEGKNKALKDAKEKEKLAEMDEVERYKTIADNETKKRGELELEVYVTKQIEGLKLSKIERDLLTSAPWRIPPVREELGDDGFTYDDALASLKRHLPTYLESLKVGDDDPAAGEPENPSDTPVDPERNLGETTVQKHHFYTEAEIRKISADPDEWAKHEAKILAQLEKHGGKLPAKI